MAKLKANVWQKSANTGSEKCEIETGTYRNKESKSEITKWMLRKWYRISRSPLRLFSAWSGGALLIGNLIEIQLSPELTSNNRTLTFSFSHGRINSGPLTSLQLVCEGRTLFHRWNQWPQGAEARRGEARQGRASLLPFHFGFILGEVPSLVDRAGNTGLDMV